MELSSGEVLREMNAGFKTKNRREMGVIKTHGRSPSKAGATALIPF
jgi:hypothetical protein